MNRADFRNAFNSILERVEAIPPHQGQQLDALFSEYRDLEAQLEQHPVLRNDMRLQVLVTSVLSALSFKMMLRMMLLAGGGENA